MDTTHTTPVVAQNNNDSSVDHVDGADNGKDGNNYLLLIEFVHRHLNFHNAELLSIFEMNGIKIGSDCQFCPLPNESNTNVTTNKDSKESSIGSNFNRSSEGSNSDWDIHASNVKRPFRIISFPWKSIGSRFSVYDDFDIKGSDGGSGNAKSNNVISLVAALSRCTLIRSVIELWGRGTTIEACAADIQNGKSPQRHQEGTHLDPPVTQPIPPTQSTNQNEPHELKAPTNIQRRSWKITIHTLGSTYSRDEQSHMRGNFSFLQFPGQVIMDSPDDEYIFIREVELDDKGGAVYPRHGIDGKVIEEHEKRPPLGCYFGRVLGNKSLGRNWRANRLDKYSLKKRVYLGPTSMDSELSLIMTNLACIQHNSVVFDPFVGTGSILLTAALRGAFTFGTDIDLRVLRGRNDRETIINNFKQYGLRPPELVRSDNSIYHRHYRESSPLFNAIICDPPYGIRAGARKSGSRKEEVRPVLDEHRHDHVAQTKPYAVSDVMVDLLNVAAMTLVMGGKLVYVIPSMLDFDETEDLPRHDCLELVSVCYQPLQTELGRRTVTMEKVHPYNGNKREEYVKYTWVNGPQSAEKVASIRERLLEVAKKKPGYEEKAALRKQKRKATKEAKKKAKREGNAGSAGGDFGASDATASSEVVDINIGNSST